MRLPRTTASSTACCLCYSLNNLQDLKFSPTTKSEELEGKTVDFQSRPLVAAAQRLAGDGFLPSQISGKKLSTATR